MAQAEIPPEASQDFPPGCLAEDIFHATMRPIYSFFDVPYPWDAPTLEPREKR